MLDKTAIKAIIDRFPGRMENKDGLAEWMATELQIISGIRAELEKLRKSRADLQAGFERECKAIQDRTEVIRRKCQHQSLTLHPRSTANDNDSYTDCNICGQVIS